MNSAGIFFLTETGNKKNQEDYIWPVAGEATADSRVFLVCDGVGGSANGEIASKIIAESAGKQLSFFTENISPANALEILQQAKRELVTYARANGLNNDMATTIVLLVMMRGKAFIGWCGDSRVYHVRKGKIVFKTEDHSLVNNLVKKGELTEEEAKRHPKKNVILKAVTADDSMIDAEFHTIEKIEPGDYFLLCTDGLLENISDSDICNLLKPPGLDNAGYAAYFKDKCEGKTRDNYSMYLLKVDDESIAASVTGKRKKLIPVLLLFVLCAIVSVSFYIRSTISGKPGHTNSGPVRLNDTIQPDPAIQKKELDTLPELEMINTDSIAQLSKKDTVPARKKNILINRKKGKKTRQ
jgi:PPM family protein phosphatase